MGPNTVELLAMGVNAGLSALIQMQQYQILVAKAQAEGQDISDEVLAAERAKTRAQIDFLAAQASGQPPLPL